jgi:hypothetical protein
LLFLPRGNGCDRALCRRNPGFCRRITAHSSLLFPLLSAVILAVIPL